MTAPGGKRELLRAEARYLARALGQGGAWGFGVVFSAALLFGGKVLIFDSEPGSRLVLGVVILGYAIYNGVIAGLLGAVGTFLFRTVRGWMLVPVIVVPATLCLSAWLFRGVLDGQLNDVLAAMARAAREHDLMIDAIGPAARVGPIILVVILPLLMIDLGVILTHPSVLWQLFVLAAEVFLVVALGAVPSATLSLVALGFAYARGFRRRHSGTAPASA